MLSRENQTRASVLATVFGFILPTILAGKFVVERMLE